MAIDWIKIEFSTPDKPEVIGIADSLGILPQHAFGSIFMIWRWFDQHTEKGNAVNVTKVTLDRLSGVSGFSDAMLKVGWLIVDDNGVSLPNFERHCGQSSKKRALTAKRVAAHKAKSNAKGNADSVSQALPTALPREEKRREENKETSSPTCCAGLDVAAWTKWVEYRKQIKKPLKPISMPSAQKAMAEMADRQMEAVDHTIANGWTGLFMPNKPSPQSHQSPTAGRVTTINGQPHVLPPIKAFPK